LLTKAGEAKEKSEESTVIEKLQVEVLGSYNKNGKVDIEQLKTNLKHLNITNEDIIPTIKDEEETFPVIAKINNCEFDIREDGTVEKHIDFDTLESAYGKVVNGYSGYEATDVIEWKLLYVDEENRDAIIISSNTLPVPQPTENGIPLVSESGIVYSGFEDVMNYEYGKKYNGLWIDKCKTEKSNNNSKATAYLCDPDNWDKYRVGKAKYAAGGPTYEILIASYYDKQVKDFRDSGYSGEGSYLKDLNEIGYFANRDANLRIRDGLYLPVGIHYWIASPADSSAWKRSKLIHVHASAFVHDAWYQDNNIGLRPVVCLPASAIEVVGEGKNITLNYK